MDEQTFTVEYRDLYKGERVLFETDVRKDAVDMRTAVIYLRTQVLVAVNF